MGSISRRLRSLENRMRVSDDELGRHMEREMLRRLTDEELHWLAEPAGDAGPETDVSPEAGEEMARRWKVLCERYREVLEREPVP